MARGKNSVMLAGTLTENPELRYSPGGLAILTLNLAGNDRVVGHDDTVRNLAWYHRALMFGDAAEKAAAEFAAGDPVFVDGTLNYRSWEGHDGARKSSLDVKALRSRRCRSGHGRASRRCKTPRVRVGWSTRSTKSASSAT